MWTRRFSLRPWAFAGQPWADPPTFFLHWGFEGQRAIRDEFHCDFKILGFRSYIGFMDRGRWIHIYTLIDVYVQK